jgi:RHS repeat-associated protein
LIRPFNAICVVIVLVATAHAQIGNLDDTNTPPIPGIGHDFIKMLGETVNPANGSVSLHIDLPMPKGRGLDIPLAITYSSNGVQHVGANTNGGGNWVNDFGQSTGSGWSYSVPTLSTVQGIQSTYHQGPPPYTETCYYYYAYVMRDWTGTPHAFNMQAAQAPYSGDNCSQQLSNILNGSDDFMQAVTTPPNNAFSPNPATVVGPDGTVYQFDPSQNLDGTNGAYSFWAAANSIEDRNGNLATTSFRTDSKGVIYGNITDTLGRQVFSASAIGSDMNTIQVSGLGASYTQYWQSANINFTPNSIQVGPWPCTGSQLGSDVSSDYVVKTLTLPNGKSFQFYYDSQYGLLNKIVYPTGGYISYQWGFNPLSQFIGLPGQPLGTGVVCYTIYDYPAITQRTVSYDGVNIAEKQTFSYSTSWPPPAQNTSGSWTSKQTIVTTYDMVRNTHFQTSYTYAPYFSVSSGGPLVPMENTIVYNDPNGVPLKTVTKAWGDHFLLGCELQTLDNGSISGIWFSYGSGGELTDKKEYDYGLISSASSCRPYGGGSSPPPTGITPTRETTTTYQSFSVTPIFPRSSIFNRPQSVITYDHGTRIAETAYAYDGNSIGAVSAVGHDDYNYPTTYANRGNATTKTVNCFIGSTACTNSVSTYTYDQTGQVLSITDPCGNGTCTDMVGTNHTTILSYTDNYLGGSGTSPGNTNAYVTTITYPAVGSVTTHEYFQYAYSDGQLTSSQDDNDLAAGKSTTYSYENSLRRIAETDYPDGGKKTWCYKDATGQCADNVAPVPSVLKSTLIDSATTLTTTTTMDGVGHVIKTQLTSDPEGTDTTDTTYDGLGRVYTQSNPHRSGSSTTDGTTTKTYDALGRIVAVLQPDGSQLSTSYSGNCTTVTDEAGNMRKSCTDALGHLTKVWEDPGSAPHLNYETDYQYNALDNLLCAVQKATDASPFTTCAAAPAAWRPRSFQYDSLSRITSATNPESGTISYSYDVNGNLKQRSSPKPNQTNPALTTNINYCYDALNRVTSKAYTSTACPPSPAVATYTYDQGTNGIGRRTGMTDAPGSSSWTYDLLGRILSETRITSGVTKTTSYVYNLDGSVKSITYPSTHTVNYTYSAAGRALSAIDPAGPINYETSATYAPPGELVMATNGFVQGGFTGINTANVYNNRLQPLLLSATNPTAMVFSLCYDFHLKINISLPPCNFNASTVGDNGNVYQVVNNRDTNRTQNFVYDSLNRILQGYTSGTNWGEDFTIDAWANLTNRSLHAGKTNSEPLNAAPALTSNQLTGFGYDAAGNITSDGTLGYNYDQESRLTKFVGNTTDIYIYDGDGERVKKSVPTVTLYWYGATGNILDETGGTGMLVSEYIFFNGKRVARRDADNTVKYYFADNLGSASVITNATGAMPPLAESDYYPYGGEIPITSSDPNHYKFTGKERDTESGLDNFGARYFTSNLGRFMTPDWAARPTSVPYAVFGDPQSLNLYTYVENAPLNRVDADGHCANGLLDSQVSYACVAGAQENKTDADKKTAESAQNNQQTRADVAATAEKYNGSTDWAFSKQKGAFACNTNKCNAFVGDVTKEAGAPASVTGKDGKSRYPLAAEWADKNTKIDNWRALGKGEAPQPGDVAAYKLSGGGASYSGHSGIVTSVDANGVVHGMAAHENVVGPDNKFDRSVTPTVVYRRYTGDE